MTDRCGPMGFQHEGEIVSVPVDEARRMIDVKQAEPVRETASVRPPNRPDGQERAEKAVRTKRERRTNR